MIFCLYFDFDCARGAFFFVFVVLFVLYLLVSLQKNSTELLFFPPASSVALTRNVVCRTLMCGEKSIWECVTCHEAADSGLLAALLTACEKPVWKCVRADVQVLFESTLPLNETCVHRGKILWLSPTRPVELASAIQHVVDQSFAERIRPDNLVLVFWLPKQFCDKNAKDSEPAAEQQVYFQVECSHTLDQTRPLIANRQGNQEESKVATQVPVVLWKEHWHEDLSNSLKQHLQNLGFACVDSDLQVINRFYAQQLPSGFLCKGVERKEHGMDNQTVACSIVKECSKAQTLHRERVKITFWWVKNVEVWYDLQHCNIITNPILVDRLLRGYEECRTALGHLGQVVEQVMQTCARTMLQPPVPSGTSVWLSDQERERLRMIFLQPKPTHNDADGFLPSGGGSHSLPVDGW